jgi:hypothetical protein
LFHTGTIYETIGATICPPLGSQSTNIAPILVIQINNVSCFHRHPTLKDVVGGAPQRR